MSDIHILTGSAHHWRLVLHFPVPGGNNPAGVAWQTALVNSGLGGTTILTEGVGAGQITTAEKTQIATGAVYEHVVDFLLESGGTTGAQRQASLDAFYAAEQSRVLAWLQQQLKYFGFTRDVP